MASDEELRERAQRLRDRHRKKGTWESEQPAPASEPAPESKAEPKKHRDYKSIATQGVSGAALIAVVVQLLQARVSPEQIKALSTRVQQIEDERGDRRQYEFERDRIDFCRNLQQDEYLQQILPDADRQVKATPPKPWFDRCPEPPKPTTGTGPKSPEKK